MTLQDARRQAAKQLRLAGIETPDLDARLLAEFATGWDRTELILKSQDVLPADELRRLTALTKRRASGEPIDHILGYREFYGRNFSVNRHVLSPRPETEGLVDEALKSLQGQTSPRLLDLGTGSGAIIITLLAETKDATGMAVDISDAALKTAIENAAKHDVSDRLSFAQSHWFGNIDGDFDLIVSNPPYITDQAMRALSAEVKNFDPDISLRGGEDGLSAYREITARAQDYLKLGGGLIVEIGYDQGESVTALFQNAGFRNVRLFQDLSGHDRIIKAIK